MDAAKGTLIEGLLTPAELAGREDFSLGDAAVSPSTRTMVGPGGSALVQPRAMQVLVLLADAGGQVVSREAIFNRCWGGIYVGDDSLNRAIGTIRRLAADIAHGSFEVETIPRIGYRLVTRPAPAPPEAGTSLASRVTRRQVAAGAAGAASLAVTGLWWSQRPPENPHFKALIERGEDALRLDEPGAAKLFEQATAVAPNSAQAYGLLAYALASGGENGPRAMSGRDAALATRAARTALEIDPNESNALLAMTLIQLDMMDRLSREEQLRRILAIHPHSARVMRSLAQSLHAVGRCRASLGLVERALAIEPLTPTLHRSRAMGLWNMGSISEADRVSNRAMELWPSHRLVRMARLMIYAFTGRPRAALAMIEEEEKQPVLLSEEAVSVWRLSLQALATPTRSAIAEARNANIDGAKSTPATAAYAILILSALGELDAAFAVAEGFLLGRGSVVLRPSPPSNVPSVNNFSWRNTLGLFTPPTSAMRLDPRFKSLADGLGLTDYWMRSGIGPDDFLFRP